MNPWLVGGAGALLVALLWGAKASGTATTGYLFKDYAWVTVLPTFTGAGGDRANPLARQLPPPPGVTQPGTWQPFPSGYWVEGQTSNGRAQSFLEWPGVTQGNTVWMWFPNIGESKGSTANIMQLNGYWVATSTWKVALSSQAAIADGADPTKVSSFEAANGPISPTNRWLSGAQIPPPPPGQTSGEWQQKHPGYLVWINAQNAQKGDPEMAASALSASYMFGGTATANPLPAPSAQPIAVTPPPAVAPATTGL